MCDERTAALLQYKGKEHTFLKQHLSIMRALYVYQSSIFYSTSSMIPKFVSHSLTGLIKYCCESSITHKDLTGEVRVSKSMNVEIHTEDLLCIEILSR